MVDSLLPQFYIYRLIPSHAKINIEGNFLSSPESPTFKVLPQTTHMNKIIFFIIAGNKTKSLRGIVILYYTLFPYFFSSSLKSMETELMQHRSPVGSGPSLNTCPKWLSHLLQVISIRFIPKLLSLVSSTDSGRAS